MKEKKNKDKKEDKRESKKDTRPLEHPDRWEEKDRDKIIPFSERS